MIARLLLLAFFAVSAHAQEAARPYGAKPVRGEILDAETGKPLPGAIVVARWDWLKYYAGGYHSSPSFADEGEIVYIAEAVTDMRGQYAISGIAPKLRAGGKVADGAPTLTVFLSGYQPFQEGVGDQGRPTVRLKRHVGTSAELAAKLATIQGDERRGLHWLSPVATWKGMPQMVAALHREKARLGDEGAAVLAAHRLVGRSGRGTVADSRTGQGLRAEKLPGEPYPTGAVRIAWTMRRIDGTPGTMRLVYAKSLAIGESPSVLVVSPWSIPGPDSTPGWEAVKEAPALVRIYASGYRRGDELRWEEAGGTVRLEKLAASREAVVENARAIRRDLDAEPVVDRAKWIADMRPLLALFAAECRALTPDLRAGICFADDSDVVAELRRPNVVALYDRERDDGPRPQVAIAQRAGVSQIQAQSPGASAILGSTIQARSVAMTPSQPGQRRDVGGFTIEPVKR